MTKAARVHHRTVTEVSEGRHTKSRQKKASVPRSSPVQSLKVRPDVWATALDLCEGEPGRIQIISESHVIVWNDKKWRKRRT